MISQPHVYIFGFVFVVIVWLGTWNLIDSWRIKLFGDKNFGNYLAILIGIIGLLILLSLTGNL